MTTHNELEELAVILSDKLQSQDSKSPISQAILDLIKEKRKLRRL